MQIFSISEQSVNFCIRTKKKYLIWDLMMKKWISFTSTISYIKWNGNLFLLFQYFTYFFCLFNIIHSFSTCKLLHPSFSLRIKNISRRQSTTQKKRDSKRFKVWRISICRHSAPVIFAAFFSIYGFPSLLQRKRMK